MSDGENLVIQRFLFFFVERTTFFFDRLFVSHVESVIQESSSSHSVSSGSRRSQSPNSTNGSSDNGASTRSGSSAYTCGGKSSACTNGGSDSCSSRTSCGTPSQGCAHCDTRETRTVAELAPSTTYRSCQALSFALSLLSLNSFISGTLLRHRIEVALGTLARQGQAFFQLIGSGLDIGRQVAGNSTKRIQRVTKPKERTVCLFFCLCINFLLGLLLGIRLDVFAHVFRHRSACEKFAASVSGGFYYETFFRSLNLVQGIRCPTF